MKYLSEEQLTAMVKNNNICKDNRSTNNMSIASLEYMKRYGLMSMLEAPAIANDIGRILDINKLKDLPKLL